MEPSTWLATGADMHGLDSPSMGVFVEVIVPRRYGLARKRCWGEVDVEFCFVLQMVGIVLQYRDDRDQKTVFAENHYFNVPSPRCESANRRGHAATWR